jgi:hypothetical protein
MQRDGPAEPQPALAHYLERAARHQLRALKCLTQSVPRSQAVRSASQRQRERAWAIEHLLLARSLVAKAQCLATSGEQHTLLVRHLHRLALLVEELQRSLEAGDEPSGGSSRAGARPGS